MHHGPENFIGLFGNLQARHPGIELQIMDASAAKLQHLLIEGSLEAAIRAVNQSTTTGT